jgi:hypothetical protein
MLFFSIFCPGYLFGARLTRFTPIDEMPEPSGFYPRFPIFRKVYQVVSTLQVSRCRATFALQFELGVQKRIEIHTSLQQKNLF